MMRMAGSFITLEGGEGVGKSTNLAFVVEHLQSHGLEVVATREPGGTPLAEQLRELLLEVRQEPMEGLTELLLLFAARAQHLATVIKPALAAGRWVVCDRFTDATYAYQGGGRGIASSAISTLEQLVQADLRPDLTIYLDVPIALSARRIADREHDRFEREAQAFFDAVRAAYLARAADNDAMHVVDASGELAVVQQGIARVLDAYLRQAGPC